MTEEEIDLWFALAEVAGEFLRRPRLHPPEKEEAAGELHHLQNRWLARPGLRVHGCPR